MWLAEPLILTHPGRTVTVATVAGASIAQYREEESDATNRTDLTAV
jgi:hypothetical protein